MGEVARRFEKARLAARIYAALCLLSVAAFYVLESEIWQNVAYSVLTGATVVAAEMGRRLHAAIEDRHWSLFFRAMTFFFGGTLVSIWEAAAGLDPMREVGLSDILTVTGYLFVLGALLALARARAPQGETADLIDALIVAGGVGLALWIAWVGPMFSASSLTTSERVSALAFPLFNITILTLLLRLTFTPGPRSRAYYLFISAVVASLVASQWNLSALHDGTYGPGHPLEAARMLAYVLAGLAVLHPSMTELGENVPSAKSMLTQPRLLMFGAGSLAGPIAYLLTMGNESRVRAADVVIGSSFIFFLMIIRMWTLLKSIRRREEHFRSLVQNSADGIVLLNGDRKVVYVSDATTTILGYSAEELLDSNNTFDFVHADDLPLIREHFERLSAPGAKERVELRATRKDGSLRWLAVDVVNLLHHPSVQGVVINFRDITERRESEERAREADASYRELFENAVEGIFESSADGRVIRANPALAKMLGYESPDEMIATAEVARHYADPNKRKELIDRVLAEGRVDNFLFRALTKDGRELHCSMNVVGYVSENGELATMHGLISDVTDRQRAVQELRESEERFRSLVQHSSDAIVVVDQALRITYASPSLERLFQTERTELLGRPLTTWLDRSTSDFETLLLLQTGHTEVLSCSVRRPGGDEVSLEVVATNMLEDESVRGIVLNLRDVSERVALEKQLRHEAFHDPLTGLANRALFLDRLTHALQRATRSDEDCYVMFLDLDNFKRINDGQGHNVGDECLQMTAGRLLGCSRVSDTVARMGGDEFAILLEATTVEGAVALAQRIVEKMAEPLVLPTGDVVLTPSIGIAPASGDEDAKSILRNADVAMYLAKRSTERPYEVFERSMYAETVRRIEIESELRRAIRETEFDIHIQPVMELETRTPVGGEALVRWQHPERGIVYPGDFIEVAEETGLIIDIGTSVLNGACRTLARWSKDPSTSTLTMWVNISARQLGDPALVDQVRTALSAAGADPALLVLEITESVMAEAVEDTITRLGDLKGLGVQLAIDDFGTGYSSLSYLQNFPVDILKIDRSFTSQLDVDTGNVPLAHAVVGIGQSLGLVTVAEGVETEAQSAALRELGCTRAQGFLFARPMPADDFTGFVQLTLGNNRETASAG